MSKVDEQIRERMRIWEQKLEKLEREAEEYGAERYGGDTSFLEKMPPVVQSEIAATTWELLKEAAVFADMLRDETLQRVVSVEPDEGPEPRFRIEHPPGAYSKHIRIYHSSGWAPVAFVSAVFGHPELHVGCGELHCLAEEIVTEMFRAGVPEDIGISEHTVWVYHQRPHEMEDDGVFWMLRVDSWELDERDNWLVVSAEIEEVTRAEVATLIDGPAPYYTKP